MARRKLEAVRDLMRHPSKTPRTLAFHQDQDLQPSLKTITVEVDCAAHSTPTYDRNAGKDGSGIHLQSPCPICQTMIPQAYLYPHFQFVDGVPGREVIELVKAYNPGWVEDDGICPRCWHSHLDAVRAMHILKSGQQRSGRA